VDSGERKVGRGRGRLRVEGDGWGKVGKAGKEGLVTAINDDEEEDEDDDDEDEDGDDDGDDDVGR
jgi:hypothetical protein